MQETPLGEMFSVLLGLFVVTKQVTGYVFGDGKSEMCEM